MRSREIPRRKTKGIMIGNVGVGSAYPISIQSMTNTDTRNVIATSTQIKSLAQKGCEIVRVTVPDNQGAAALQEIVRKSPIPVIADIHFDYRLALSSMEKGIQGLRLNPGNIGAEWKVREVVKAANERNLPIRIGVNSGSLDKRILERHGGITAEAMVESALKHIDILEKENFSNIKVSLKASYVPLMLEAYRLLAKEVEYPFHLGVTEAGLPGEGSIKSAIGIGALLAQGIGDTIRVSLTGDPEPEIDVAKSILRNLGLRNGVEVISCPTCGRTQIDLYPIAKAIEERVANLNIPLTIAVMGCAVNGPGEARGADLGIAGGKGEALLFVKGEIVRKVPEKEIVQAVWEEIEKYLTKENE